jgi:predicted transcriptional regulator
VGFTLKPAIKDNFIDREILLDEMITTLTNRKIDMGFALIGIPFYLQLLGRQLERTDIEPINKEVIERVFKETLAEEGDVIFSEEFYRLSDRERATLRAMAGMEKSKLNEISRRLDEGTNVVSKYLEYLVTKGMVRKEERGMYKVGDPVFSSWLKEKFR